MFVAFTMRSNIELCGRCFSLMVTMQSNVLSGDAKCDRHVVYMVLNTLASQESVLRLIIEKSLEIDVEIKVRR